MKRIMIFAVFFALLAPFSYAHVGCLEIDDDVFVQLTSSPITAVEGKPVAYLLSFVDQKGLIRKEIKGKIFIQKDKNTVLDKNFTVADGILELKHTYMEPGLYEIFTEFEYNGKKYKPGDFLVEVTEKEKFNRTTAAMLLLVGFAVGISAGIFIRKEKRKK